MISLGFCSSKTRIHATGRVRRSIPGGEAAGSTVALMSSAQWWRRPSASSSLRQLLWRLRSRWRHATTSRRGRGRFGYDPESYLQNFDDGLSRDHAFRYATPVGV